MLNLNLLVHNVYDHDHVHAHELPMLRLAAGAAVPVATADAALLAFSQVAHVEDAGTAEQMFVDDSCSDPRSKFIVIVM